MPAIACVNDGLKVMNKTNRTLSAEHNSQRGRPLPERGWRLVSNNSRSSVLDFPQPKFGFSLVELVICILIIGILVAVAAPRFYSVADEAKVNQTATEARKLNQLFAVSKQVTGNWPANGAPGVVPTELLTLFPSGKFPAPPVGGTWTWYRPATGAFGMAVIVAGGKRERNEFQLMDSKFDDGIEDTGSIIRSDTGSDVYWIFSAQ